MRKNLTIITLFFFILSHLIFAEEIIFEKGQEDQGGAGQEIILINKIIKYRNDAREYFLNGQYSKSIAQYEQLLNINPDDNVANREMELAKTARKYLDDARITFAEKNYEAVIVACTQLLSLNPSDQQGSTLLESSKNILRYYRDAENFFAQGKINLAILSYNEILKISPDDKEIFEKIKACTNILDAKKLFNAGSYPEAMSKYRQVLTLKPNNALLLKELKLAKDVLDSRTEARVSLGEHNYKEAAIYYQQVLELNRNDKEAYDKLTTIGKIAEELGAGDEYFVKGFYDSALTHYNTALKLDQFSSVINDRINFAKRAQEFKAEGKIFFQRVPGQLQNYETIVEKLLEEEISEKIRKQEEQLTKEFIRYRKEARNNFARGEYDTSYILYKQALAINPADQQLQKEMARCKKAIELMEKGKALFADGKYIEAKEVFRELISLTSSEKSTGSVIVGDGSDLTDGSDLVVYEPLDKQVVYSYFVNVQGVANEVAEVEINDLKIKPTGGGKFYTRLPLYRLGKNLVNINVQKGDKTIKKVFRILRLADFNDVNQDAAYEVGIIATLGLLSGDSKGNFYPDGFILRKDFEKMLFKLDDSFTINHTGDYITRKEAIVYLSKALKLPIPIGKEVTGFKDIATNDPDFGYLIAAEQGGIFYRSTDNLFNPSDYLKRIEAVRLFLNISRIRTEVKELINWEAGF
ncbi:MAG: S-layer homology domain-containing protein [Candidatus Margulisiibacteriota bacterium]